MQEAHKMVADANIKRIQAEKRLAESDMKVRSPCQYISQPCVLWIRDILVRIRVLLFSSVADKMLN
jgi:hypothetical protein